MIIIGLCFTLLLSNNVFAQKKGDHSERWEKYKAEKIAFLTSNLDLTPKEAQKFWPVYNQMEKERSEAQMNRRELEQKVRDAAETLSDKEIIALTREFASNMEEEGALTAKYNEEYLKILPPKKVLQLYKAEGEFRMHMFNKYRNKRRDGKSNDD